MPPSTTTIQGGARAHRARPDNHASSVSRVQLKLSALAHVNTCVGSSPSMDLALASVAALCNAAVRYFVALTGGGSTVQVHAYPEDAGVAARRLNLQLAATAYASTRHGVDACMEFTRIAIGALCDAAIAYASTLTRTDAGGVTDRTLDLDDGR